MRFSRTAWNNVIIFSVMAYILVINVTSQKIFDRDNVNESSPQEISLVGNNAVILALTINDRVTIERVGQSWRANPEVISGQALEQMMMSWQSATAYPAIPDQEEGIHVGDTPGVNRVKVFLANQQQPIKLVLVPDLAQVLITSSEQSRPLSISVNIYRQLIPFELN